jgi:hypothetical protein
MKVVALVLVLFGLANSVTLRVTHTDGRCSLSTECDVGRYCSYGWCHTNKNVGGECWFNFDKILTLKIIKKFINFIYYHISLSCFIKRLTEDHQIFYYVKYLKKQ